MRILLIDSKKSYTIIYLNFFLSEYHICKYIKGNLIYYMIFFLSLFPFRIEFKSYNISMYTYIELEIIENRYM